MLHQVLLLPVLRGSALTGDNLLLQKEAKLGRTKLSTRQMTDACIKQMHRAQKVKIFEVKKKKSVERFFLAVPWLVVEPSTEW